MVSIFVPSLTLLGSNWKYKPPGCSYCTWFDPQCHVLWRCSHDPKGENQCHHVATDGVCKVYTVHLLIWAKQVPKPSKSEAQGKINNTNIYLKRWLNNLAKHKKVELTLSSKSHNSATKEKHNISHESWNTGWFRLLDANFSAHFILFTPSYSPPTKHPQTTHLWHCFLSPSYTR